MQKTILVFCAHSDDEAIGMGGTIAKYVEKGKQVIKVVFSYGEQSHPHLQQEVIIKERVGETEEASKFLGIKKTIFLGVKDTKVKKEVDSYIKNKVKKLIEKYRPEKIFIPSQQDPHPDHQAVHKTILEVVDELRKNYPVYAFEVWNLITEEKPSIYEDITKYFKKKMHYVRMFKSQWMYMYALYLPAYFRARKYGKKVNGKYAERFYKLR